MAIALTTQEDQMVYEALLAELVYTDTRGRIVGALKDVNLLAQIADGQPDQVIRRAINVCLNDGDRLSPPALVKLLEIIEVREARVGPLIQRLKAPPALGADAFDDTVLGAEVPFLERLTLRVSLKKLLTAMPQKPFVVVTGDHKQGKSYTIEFINHVLQAHPGILPASVELTPEQGPATGPGELASDIVARFGGEQSTRPELVTNLDRWLEELVTWVTETGGKTEFNWWIVLDGFNAKELRSDTAQFIAKLAKRLEFGLQSRRFRLILIDFDRAKLPVMVTKVAQDATAPVTRSNVQAFIQLLLAGASTPLDVTKITDKVMTDLPDPVTELGTLNERLTELIAEVRA